MQEIIIEIMNNYGYLGIMFLIFIENIFPPIPSEVILSFGGFATTLPNAEINILGVIIFSTIGAILGALVLYSVGRILKKERLIKIVKGKVGKILRFKVEDIENADAWFNKHGTKTVFFCRFIPIIRSLISIPAGINKMAMSKFLIFTTLGTLIWNSILTTLGFLLGENWGKIAEIIDIYGNIVLIIIIILLLVGISIYYKKRIKGEKL